MGSAGTGWFRVIRSSNVTRSQSLGAQRKSKTIIDASEARQAASLRLSKLKLSSFVFMLLAIIGSFHAMSMITIETYRILTNASHVESLDADIAVIKQEIASIDAVIAHADDAYMEQLARCQGFIFPNETRYFTDLPAETTDELACKSLQ